jgi:hypothetical protein
MIAALLIMQSAVSAQTLTTNGRLRQAIKDCRDLELAAEAQKPSDSHTVAPAALVDREDSSPQKFPLRSHVARYSKCRPWGQSYPDGRFSGDPTTGKPQAWPTLADAADLTMLLKDSDPALRGIAAEALATLYRPEDAPALAGLLGDTAEAVPILGHNFQIDSRAGFAFGDTKVDTLEIFRSWRKRTVASYARAGLELITGRAFADEAAFLNWWKSNSNARHCLWYWQQRMQREMDTAEQVPGIGPGEMDYRKRVMMAKAAVAKTILAELRQLPPEVEAKVRLLTISNKAGGAPITGSETSFWPEPPSFRLDAGRLLDLLDRKGLWEDVDWDEPNKGHYNLFAERLGIWAHVLFLPEQAPRLRAAFKNEREGLWWSGKAGLIIGISRLLPAAKEDQLDDADTRDGTLREAVLHESDLFVRDYCAMELVRVGLPGNTGFLKRMAFEPIEEDFFPTLSQAILQALAEKPLTEAKGKLLVEIVLDKRFELYWTRPNKRMGDDMDRTYAVAAINAHAGRVLISDELKQALVNQSRSAEALKEVRKGVENLLQDKRK